MNENRNCPDSYHILRNDSYAREGENERRAVSVDELRPQETAIDFPRLHYGTESAG